MKTLLDERLGAVLVALAVMAVIFLTRSLVDTCLALVVLSVVFACFVAPWMKKKREQLERAEQEAAARALAEAEARIRREDLRARMLVQNDEDANFESIFYQHPGHVYLPNSASPAIPLDDRHRKLNWCFTGYYLDEHHRLRQLEIENKWSLVGAGVPDVMVVGVAWMDHEIEEVEDKFLIAKPVSIVRHERYLYWQGLPKWYALFWDEEEIVLRDLFGKTIALPAEGEMIQKVLEFVTSYDSVADYALKAIAAHAVPSLLKASANRWLKLVRIALSLGVDALGGRLLTEERWEDLVNHDPTKL